MNMILSSAFDIKTVLTVVIICAVLSTVFALLIVLVSRLTAIKEDERAEKIRDLLANANCGGCGFAGCSEFAKALCEGKADVTACGPTGNDAKREILALLGKTADISVKKTAVVHCAGGDNCLTAFGYVGNGGCEQTALFAGGNKACAFGCLGEGTCVKGCDYNALTVKGGVAVCDKDLCASCGKCVSACPKNIIELIPHNAAVYIACSSLCKGKDVMGACKNGCIGCGICAKFCPENAITVINNLPVIDYGKCSGCKTCVAKCPRKCIKEYISD